MDLDSDFWVPQRSTTEVKLGGAFHVGVEVFGMEWSGKPRSSCQGLFEWACSGLLFNSLSQKICFSLDWFVGENLQATMVFTCIYHEM